MTDINGFVRLSQRNPQRDAGLARVRQRINAERLKVAWMLDERGGKGSISAAGAARN
jgi:hypothetical protein